MLASIRSISLLLTSLLVGIMFGIWLGFNPAALNATAYELTGKPLSAYKRRQRRRRKL